MGVILMTQSLSDNFIVIRASKGDIIAKNNLILRNKKDEFENLILGLSMTLQLQYNLILTSPDNSIELKILRNNIRNVIKQSLEKLFDLYNSDRLNLKKHMSSLKYDELHRFDEDTYFFYKQTKDLDIQSDFGKISEILTNIKIHNLLSMFSLLIINTILCDIEVGFKKLTRG